MHRLPKMIVQKKKKTHTVLDKENNSKIWRAQILRPNTKTFCLHCYHCFPSARSMQARNFACVLFRQKERKKDDFPFCWRGSQPVLLHSWLVPVVGGTCTEWAWICVLHHPGEANCWQVERSGWLNRSTMKAEHVCEGGERKCEKCPTLHGTVTPVYLCVINPS